MQDHLDNYCENSSIKCPFYEYGCNAELARKEVQKHLDFELFSHNILLVSKTLSNTLCIRQYLNSLLANLTKNHSSKHANPQKARILNKPGPIRNPRRKHPTFPPVTKVQDYIYSQNTESEMASQNHSNEINLIIEPKLNDIEYNRSDKSLLSKKRKSIRKVSSMKSPRSLDISREIPMIAEYSSAEYSYEDTVLRLNANAQRHYFAFFDFNEYLDLYCEILNRDKFIAIGLAEVEKLVENRFQLFGIPNHGCFLISMNCFTWNCNNPDQNNKKIDNLTIANQDLLRVSFNRSKSELHYFVSDTEIILDRVYAKGDLKLVVIMMSEHDKISLYQY